MKINWYNTYKRVLTAQVQGEWWIIDGQAIFADGDIGDLNHNAYVIQHCLSSISGQFNIYEDESDWNSACPMIAEAIYQELLENDPDDEQKYEWKNEKDNDPDLFILNHSDEVQIDHTELMIASGHAPGREDINRYAMKNLGWIRVEGKFITTETLTAKDLKHIGDGLYDAYNEDVNKTEYTIEVMANNNVFWNVPWEVIEKESFEELMPYREKIQKGQPRLDGKNASRISTIKMKIIHIAKSTRIICDKCGKQFVIGNLESYQDLAYHARRRGWEIKDGKELCPSCHNKNENNTHSI